MIMLGDAKNCALLKEVAVELFAANLELVTSRLVQYSRFGAYLEGDSGSSRQQEENTHSSQ
jgi:hypothetical protein